MYQVSPAFLAALRTSHTLHVQVDAYQGGVPLIMDLPISEGSVTVNADTGVRRTLDLTVPDPTLWEQLRPIGTELHAYRGIRYPNGAIERVPLGVFSLDSQSMSLARDGGITLSSCPDRWARVQRARFPMTEVSVYRQTVAKEIRRLITGAIPFPVIVRELATSKVRMTEMTYSRDRDQEVIKLLTEIAAEAYFNNVGDLVVADVPKLAANPVWTVDAGAQGVMIGGDISRDRSRSYNMIVISASNTDGAPAFPTQYIQDLNPMSDSYVHGPYGVVPFFFASPVIKNVTDALKAGKALLARTRGTYTTISGKSVVNPALDRGDTIGVQGLNGVELHIVDSVTIPLTAEGTQDITTRLVADLPAESTA